MWHVQPVEIRSLLTRDRQRKLGAFVVVLAAHIGVFALVARTQPAPLQPLPTVIEVELFSPIPPPPPPPPPETASERSGGGAPAAPSRIHVPPPPRVPVPPEVPAPREQAPEPDIVVGVAPISSGAPGMGQGGQGTGAGTGVGAGDGPGRGVRSPPQNLRRPSSADILPYVPAEARRQRVSGTANVRCRIREDQRLDRCSITSEDPAGFGFGEAAIRVAQGEYRFRPPMLDGRPLDDTTVTITVEFGRQTPRG